MIRIIDGNAFGGNENIIAHQVNCLGVMGSGFAKQARILYPKAFVEYAEFCKNNSLETLIGECHLVNVGHGTDKFIANLLGQKNFGYGKQFTDVSELKRAMYKLKDFAKAAGYSIAMPYKIGPDRGGADWDEVYEMIVEVFSD